MKKTNFFKLLTLGVLSLSLGLAACNQVKEADFKDLCNRVSTVENDIAAIKTQLANLEYVVNVVPSATDQYSWTVNYTKNGVAGSLVIECRPGTGIEPGDYAPADHNHDGDYVGKGDTDYLNPRGIVTKGANGNWFIDGVDSGLAASATMPRINTTVTPNYWEFPVIGADGKAVWTKVAGSEITAQSYMVEGEDSWSIWMPTKGSTTLTEFVIPKSTVQLGKIDILGWVDGYNATKNLANHPEGMIVDADPQATWPSTEWEYYALNPEAALHTALWDHNQATFAVNYSWIGNFYGDSNYASHVAVTYPENYNVIEVGNYGTGTTLTNVPTYGAYLTGNTNQPLPLDVAPNVYTYPNTYTPSGIMTNFAWRVTNTDPAKDFGRKNVAKGDVRTMLDTENKGFVIQVSPLNASISGVKFVLENSQGVKLPIEFKEPVLITGLMTRGTATDSALYFIEGEELALTGVNSEAELANKFTSLFAQNTVWSLVTPSGLRSEYTPFTITPSFVRSRENQVKAVNEGTSPAKFVPIPTPPPKTPANAYDIHVGEWVSVGFEDVLIRKADGVAYVDAADKVLDESFGQEVTYDIGTPTTNGHVVEEGVTTNEVVDHYFRVGSNEWSDDYITQVFGLEYRNGRSEFRANKIPDNLTMASFWMDVYKLGVDGTVFVERLPFRAVGEDMVTDINYGDYLIQDEYPTVDNDYLGTAFKEISLDPMFETLSNYTHLGTDWAVRWKDETYGPHSFTFTNLQIEGITGNQIGRLMFPNVIENGVIGGPTGTDAVTGAIKLPAPQNTDAGYVGQKDVYFGDKAMGLKLTTKPGGDANNVWDVRGMIFQPNYAYSGGASLVRDKEHILTVKFYNVSGEYINTVNIHFTPKLPLPSSLFKKDENRWNNDLTVLQAYYADPVDPWRELKFYGSDVNAANDWLTLWGTGTPPVWSIGNRAYNIAPELAVNSTFYNVYNPGGTTEMTHDEFHPLDGGYLKVANRGDEVDPKQWVVDASVEPKSATAGLKTRGYGNFQSTEVNTHNDTTPGNAIITPTFTTHTIIQLTNQTNINGGTYGAGPYINSGETPNYTGIPFATGAGNAIRKEIPMEWELGKYIGYYEYTDAEKSTNDFVIKVMSALEEGALVEREPLTQNQGSIYLDITKANLGARDYAPADNNREIFKEWIGGRPAFRYNYIAKVVFSRPFEESGYDIMTQLPSGDFDQDNTEVEAVLPTATEDSFLRIRTVNTFKGGDLKINVKVYDRFGRTLEGTPTIAVTYVPQP